MAACDAFTLASAWEGLPVAVMEALALGLPIVATAVGGVAEHLDATCAVLVPPGDPAALADGLAAVIGHPDRRAVLGRAPASPPTVSTSATRAARLTSCYDELTGVTRHAKRTRRGATSRFRRDTRSGRWSTPTGPRCSSSSATSLGWADDERSSELFAWKHDENPFGPSPGWVAVADGEIVGVRLFMRWRFRRGDDRVGRPCRRHRDPPGPPGARPLHRADHRSGPTCRDEGVDLVFNTPNDQSRPGYLTMGWRVVGRLPVAVRPTSPASLLTIVRSRVPADRWSIPIDVGEEVSSWLERVAPDDRPGADDRHNASASDRALRTDLDDHVLRWRYGLPALHYRVVHDEHASIVVRLRRRGDASELVVADRFGSAQRSRPAGWPGRT